MTAEEVLSRVTEDELLHGLCGNYLAICYVDFDEDLIVPYRLGLLNHKDFSKLFGSLSTFSDIMNAYVENIVLERDRERMHEILRYEYLKEQLKGQLAFSHEYRTERDGKELFFRFKIANLEGIGELHKAVVGFADVSGEKQSEYTYYRSGRKILVVEDDENYRNDLVNILQAKYEVLCAENGEEALKILEKQYHSIVVVMTDLNMPVMDGSELIKQMSNFRQYSSIPIIVSTSSYDETTKSGIEVDCLQLGASDFIIKPYNPGIVLNRVKRFIQLRESTALLNTLERDALTGLYTKEFFFNRADEYLKEHSKEKLCLVVTDILSLKLINERYGYKTGNDVLRLFAEEGPRKLPGYILGGRIDGDKFARIVRVDENFISDNKVIKPDMGIDFPVPSVVLKHAVYYVKKSNKLSAQSMYDRAIIALQKIKYSYGVYITEYDDEFRQNMLEERLIIDSSARAIAEGQLQVYYQPKHSAEDGRITGAEGLIRWMHPDIGFMSPAKFIPVFEQNGFITQMDFYVWEEVCKSLYEWKQKGIPVVPVSINISRRDFEDIKLAEKLIALVDKYGLEHSLLHVEITESAYSENPETIQRIIRKLHRKGFKIELDDFGTGYSSMQALSSLDLDIMKLDMSIIRNDIPGSEKNLLEFSMQLAKLMKLKTVAEGVETPEQVERIKSLGGDYIQGYYYSKPLSKAEYEKYLSNT